MLDSEGRSRLCGAGAVTAAPGAQSAQVCPFAAYHHCEYNTWKHEFVRKEEITQWL
jgi:hypothetical protein